LQACMCALFSPEILQAGAVMQGVLPLEQNQKSS